MRKYAPFLIREIQRIMKIIDLLNSEKLSLSFEVFPPKTETNYDSVKHATEEIAKLSAEEREKVYDVIATLIKHSK